MFDFEWFDLEESTHRDGVVPFLAAKLVQQYTTILGALYIVFFMSKSSDSKDGLLYGYSKERLDEYVQMNGFANALEELELIEDTEEGIQLISQVPNE